MGPNLGVYPLEQTRHVGVAKSEHPRLTNVKLISKNSNLCDHNPPTLQTDGRTDRQTDRQTGDRNTALCTKVHRAVNTCSDLGCIKLNIHYKLRPTGKQIVTENNIMQTHIGLHYSSELRIRPMTIFTYTRQIKSQQTYWNIATL